MFKILLLIFISISLNASYQEGKMVFDKKCSACHKEFVPVKRLINNFTHDNKVLNLRAPAFNRVVHKMLHGKKAVVNHIDLLESKRADALEYLEDYLTFPRFSISISSVRSRKLYPKKKTMKGKVNRKEYEQLVDYILEYEKHFIPVIVKKKVRLNDKDLIKKATKYKKNILIVATTKNCRSCKYMKKKVLRNIIVKKELKKHYILESVYIDKYKLPFNLDYQCNKIVPSYFILSSKGKLKYFMQKTIKKKEFLKVLRKYGSTYK